MKFPVFPPIVGGPLLMLLNGYAFTFGAKLATRTAEWMGISDPPEGREKKEEKKENKPDSQIDPSQDF